MKDDPRRSRNPSEPTRNGPFLTVRLHITKLRRSLAARMHLLSARFGAWWGGARVHLGGGIRLYQSTTFSGPGTIRIGDRTTLGCPIGGGLASSGCELQARYPEAVISVGSFVGVNNGLLVIAAESVMIGNRCLIGKDVQILDFDAHGVAPDERRTTIGRVSPVVIGDNVWIGNNAILLKGVRIGENAIIAAGAVVTGGEYPGGSIIGGNPARVIGNVNGAER